MKESTSRARVNRGLDGVFEDQPVHFSCFNHALLIACSYSLMTGLSFRLPIKRSA
jgi:hypothetical protein